MMIIKTKKNKKLLLVRSDGIGDAVIFFSFWHAYLEMFYGYTIDVLCLPRSKDLIKSFSFVRKVIVVDTLGKFFRKRHIFYNIIVFFRMIFLKYDVVFCPMFHPHANVDRLVHFINANKKIITILIFFIISYFGYFIILKCNK